MGTSCFSSRTVCLSVENGDIWFKAKRAWGLGGNVMAAPKWVSFFSYLMYIIGVKYERHHSNISRDILDFVIIFLLLRPFVKSSVFKQKLEREKIFKQTNKQTENAILVFFERQKKKTKKKQQQQQK